MSTDAAWRQTLHVDGVDVDIRYEPGIPCDVYTITAATADWSLDIRMRDLHLLAIGDVLKAIKAEVWAAP